MSILAIGVCGAGFLVFVCFLELKDSPKACGGRERRICLNGAFAENVYTCGCPEALSIAGKFSEPEAIADYSRYVPTLCLRLDPPGTEISIKANTIRDIDPPIRLYHYWRLPGPSS